MSYYNETIGEGKLGINLIRSFSDGNQCYFHEIEQKNDVGIDAFIEFTKDGENNGKCIAVQIKTGDSYFNKAKTKAKIPIEGHYKYWKNHTLDVYGIVCDCNTDTAYWISITNFIKSNSEEIESGKIKTITFPVIEMNTLNKTTFGTVFKRLIYGNLPLLTYGQAMQLTDSKHIDDRVFAVKVLAEKYADRIATWDKLFELLRKESDFYILFYLIYYISYIPRHPDLWGDLNFTKESKDYGAKLIKAFDYDMVIKMLSLTEEMGIQRGAIGQSVESIISLIPNNQSLLIKIIDGNKDNFIGENAFAILAYYNIGYVLKNKMYFLQGASEYIETVISFCEKFGCYDLYA